MPIFNAYFYEKIICLLAGLSAWSLTARAVTISVDAEVLSGPDGAPLPAGALVILTAGSFHGPSVGSFVGGDEVLLHAWEFTDAYADFGPGIFSDITGDLSLGGGWEELDALRLYWYPGLKLEDLADGPGAGDYFGYYSDSTGTDTSDPWITPLEADFGLGQNNINLKFFTEGGAFNAGSNPDFAGEANLQVPEAAGPNPILSAVPEPGNVLGVSALLGFAMQIRFRSRRSMAN